jgi:DNA sulfur modification protein DndB
MSHDEVNVDPYYTFPAIRGIQAGREYYSTMCSLRLIPKIFLFDEEELPVEFRAQRILNKGRIPTISKYLVDNANDYVFSSITASIDGDVEFIPYGGENSNNKIGDLRIPMSSRIIINDGQHRRAAIEQALKERPEIGTDTTSVVFFIDTGLKKSQQMFADLNQHAVRPTKSLGILYDHRDPFSRFIIMLISNVPVFKDRVELEKISISNRSLKFFTLSSIYQANRALLAKNKVNESVSEEEYKLATEFWTVLSEYIPQWKLLMSHKVSPDELRRDYIHSHGVALHAMGIAGHYLLERHPHGWKKYLKNLESVDWSRSNSKIWEGRATIGGVVSKARTNLMLTGNYLKKVFDLPLTVEEQKLEKLVKTKGKEERAIIHVS